MLGRRPLFVLFGSSIVQYSFSNGGWGAALADIYARKVWMDGLLSIFKQLDYTGLFSCLIACLSRECASILL
jgi:hypothetical protein